MAAPIRIVLSSLIPYWNKCCKGKPHVSKDVWDTVHTASCLVWAVIYCSVGVCFHLYSPFFLKLPFGRVVTLIQKQKKIKSRFEYDMPCCWSSQRSVWWKKRHIIHKIMCVDYNGSLGVYLNKNTAATGNGNLVKNNLYLFSFSSIISADKIQMQFGMLKKLLYNMTVLQDIFTFYYKKKKNDEQINKMLK